MITSSGQWLPIVTCIIAYVALSSWKQQKKHELRIEIFANSRSAMGMIRSIRDPITFEGEITDDVISERQRVNIDPPTPEEYRYMIFLTRTKKTYEQYQQLLLLREKIWAEYDENHIFIGSTIISCRQLSILEMLIMFVCYCEIG